MVQLCCVLLPSALTLLSRTSIFPWPFLVLLSHPQNPNTPPKSPERVQQYNSGLLLCRRSYASDAADHSYPASPNHPAQLLAPAAHLAPAEHKEGALAAPNPPEHGFRPAAGSRQNSLTRLQQPHAPPPPETVLNGPRPHLVKDYG